MEKSHLADLSKHQQLFLINGILVQNTFVISSLLKVSGNRLYLALSLNGGYRDQSTTIN
jgi:hypothetical protein